MIGNIVDFEKSFIIQFFILAEKGSRICYCFSTDYSS